MRPVLQAIVFVMLCVTIMNARGETRYGIVRDKETLRPLEGVLVTETGSGAVQTTDSAGRFLFTAAAVRSEPAVFGNNAAIRWNARTNTLDFRNMPGLTDVRLYRINGELLMQRQPGAGITSLSLPPTGPGVYLLNVTTRSGRVSLKLIQLPVGRQFAVATTVTPRVPDKRAAVTTLQFRKNLYRSKKFTYDTDSSITEFIVDLEHSIGDYLFMDTVRTYRLTIAESDMTTLLDYQMLSPRAGMVNTVYVPASLTMEGRILDSVGVRFRGDQSLWDCITDGSRNSGIRYPQFGFGNDDVCAKFAFKFNFKKYRENQRLYGLKDLNLRSMSYDPTKMHERLAFSFFHDMGIIAPRTAYARLYVNNAFWGLFCVVEKIDGRMTKHRFPENGDGNLYKDLWPDSLTTDDMIREAKSTNEDSAAIDDFTAFRDAVVSSATTDANFIATIGRHVDIPYCIRYMVVDRAIMNFDGLVSVYVGTGFRMRHNFSWYKDSPAAPFILIPWDLDKVFLYPEPNFWTDNHPVGTNTIPNWNVINSDYTPVGCYFDPSTIAMNYLGSGPYYDVAPIDSDKFLRLFRKTTWKDFVATGNQFLDDVFRQDTVDTRITRWRQQIAPAVGEDPTIDSTAWESMVDSLSRTIPLLRRNLELMIDTLIERTP